MSRLRYEVELTTSGYLYLNADLAATHFPNDAVVATIDAGKLLLWPTSGASAGGLLLKQRNSAGDRCVLVSEIMPPETAPGKKEALWDQQRFHLSIDLHTPVSQNAIAAQTFIEEEQRRWVVYLEVGFWETGEGSPIKVVRSRINDYATRRDAEVAASWIQRSAERNVTRPVEGG